MVEKKLLQTRDGVFLAKLLHTCLQLKSPQLLLDDKSIGEDEVCRYLQEKLSELEFTPPQIEVKAVLASLYDQPADEYQKLRDLKLEQVQKLIAKLYKVEGLLNTD